MDHKLKIAVVRYLHEQGADKVGVASCETWHEVGMVPQDYRPSSIWPPAKSVIVLGLQMPLPIVETTPSSQHMELYRTCNRVLDRWLNRRGHASLFFSRDGYARIDVLLQKPAAAFAHIFAAQYAGLGNIGVNHTILTNEFGPRVRLVSVLTEAELPPDRMLRKPLCVRCHACVDCCPVQAFTYRKDSVVAEYDKLACAQRAKLLVEKGRYPCGICIKVCPVGSDRDLYHSTQRHRQYLEEQKALVRNQDDPAYREWTHVRRHGSWPLSDELFPEFGPKTTSKKGKKKAPRRRQ